MSSQDPLRTKSEGLPCLLGLHAKVLRGVVSVLCDVLCGSSWCVCFSSL